MIDFPKDLRFMILFAQFNLYILESSKFSFLQHYVEHYNCIELNATHYKIYGAKGIEKWAEKARKWRHIAVCACRVAAQHVGGEGCCIYATAADTIALSSHARGLTRS